MPFARQMSKCHSETARPRPYTINAIMPSSHQESAIKRLEELFKDISLVQPPQQTKPIRIVKVETEIDRCCEVHGKNYRTNCSNKKNPNTTTKIITTAVSPVGRRGSLNIPASPTPKDAHPSSFPNSLRKDAVGASSVGNVKKDNWLSTGNGMRRNSLNKSTSSLRSVITPKSTTRVIPITNVSAAPKTTKPKSILKQPTGKLMSNGKIAPVLSSTAKIRENLNSGRGEASTRSYVPSLLGKTTRANSLYNSRRFSVDSLENLSNNQIELENLRRDSVSSYEDAIWEEDDLGTSVDDEVNILMFDLLL